ncbi:MAG: arginine--tRNA ligase [Candidatus Nealsonbacteria bacterium]
MIKEDIKKLIKESITKLQKQKKIPVFDIGEIKVECPEQEIHGDYSTNIAMIIAKKAKKNPIETAELLTENFKTKIPDLFERIKILKPGFINFFVSSKYLEERVKEILKKKEKFGQLDIGRNQKVQVEFISANPTGPLTVGNARGGAFGDVLANVLKKAGYETEKAYYVNDYGMQIMTLGHSVLKDKDAKYKGDYIDDLSKRIKEKDVYKAGEKAAKIIIKEMIKKTTDNMGIKYDEWISETSFHKSGRVDKVIDKLKEKGFLYEKDGALWFKSKQYGDDRDRVIVKSDKWKTYLAGDMALHEYKFKDKKFDKVINVWGADHYGDIAGLKAIVEVLGYKNKLEIIILQFITLFEKGEKLRMSKRAGHYVTMDDLIDMVGKDAVRFFFLQRSASTHLNFDMDLAREQSQKNPVYYVQYAYARICSILKKIKAKKTEPDFSLLNHSSETLLIKQLIRFPGIIEQISKDHQVQRLPQYAFDLATAFHQFYQNCKVLTNDKKLQQVRIALISAVKITLKETFDLMGISAPEKM